MASMIILSACNFSKETQTVDLEEYIVLCLDSLERIEPQRYLRVKSEDSAALKFVVYMDSLDCTSCNMAHINDWNSVMGKANREVPVQFVFIFDISKNSRLDIIDMYKSRRFLHEVYLDSNQVTIRHNSILKKSIYHMTLIGKNGKILYAGNPINSTKAEDKLMRILTQVDVQNEK